MNNSSQYGSLALAYLGDAVLETLIREQLVLSGVSDTGKLIGDLTAKTLVIDENALFQGQCTMSNEKTSAETAKERAAASIESGS